MELLGKERINGTEVWKIQTRNPDPPNPAVEVTVWIDVNQGYRVVRILVEQGEVVQRADVDLKLYDGAHWYPARVIFDYGSPGTVWSSEEVVVLSASFNEDIDRDTFTLLGMDIGVGTQIIDRRIDRLIGYWDGRQIVNDLTGVPPAPFANVSWLDDWGMPLFGAVALGIVAGYGAYRYRLFGLGARTV